MQIPLPVIPNQIPIKLFIGCGQFSLNSHTNTILHMSSNFELHILYALSSEAMSQYCSGNLEH